LAIQRIALNLHLELFNLLFNLKALFFMKKFYAIAISALSVSAMNAQSAISACKTASGQINIVFSLKKNCTIVGRDTFMKRDSIGFHSGVNGWTTAKAFDAAGALRGVRRKAIGDSSVLVVIPNLLNYFGLAAGTAVTDLKFVFNDGVAKPTNAWSAEGKEKDAAGACQDFLIANPLTALATCGTSTQELRNDVAMTLAPNPGKSATTLFINNPKNELFTMMLADAMGRILRTEAISGATFELDNLSSGLYFVILRDSEGRSLTEKLIME
jgi:Secretion system C-terminal sorting domain